MQRVIFSGGTDADCYHFKIGWREETKVKRESNNLEQQGHTPTYRRSVFTINRDPVRIISQKARFQ